MKEDVCPTVKRLAGMVAAKHVKLLFHFAAHDRQAKQLGNRQERLSELSLGFMEGVVRYITRDRKHIDLAISTFIVRNLRRSLRAILDSRFIVTPGKGVRKPISKLQSDMARRVRRFHGNEGRCDDPALLVTDEETIDAADLRATALRLLAMLPARERQALTMWRGLWDDPHTLEECGRVMGITRERVRQIAARAEFFLQRPARSDHLRKFL